MNSPRQPSFSRKVIQSILLCCQWSNKIYPKRWFKHQYVQVSVYIERNEFSSTMISCKEQYSFLSLRQRRWVLWQLCLSFSCLCCYFVRQVVVYSNFQRIFLFTTLLQISCCCFCLQIHVMCIRKRLWKKEIKFTGLTHLKKIHFLV